MDNVGASRLTALAQLVGARLQATNKRLALAESCTGGLVAAAITDIAGSSQWFDRGFVTYSNAAKEEMLKVPATILEDFGAVSLETAEYMAIGALMYSHADYSCSITGIAGPGGGSADKPVGTVCFAWAAHQQLTRKNTQKFSGNRQQIRLQAAIAALTGLLAIIQQSDD